MIATQSVTDRAPLAPNPADVSPLTDVSLSHLRGKAGASAAASCHAVRYRLSGPVDVVTLRSRFEESIRIWQAQRDDNVQVARMPRLWVESVSGPAESKIGERRRNAEMMRPIEPLDGPDCRAVLLQYQDRTSDFIVVAHRATLDTQGLHWIAGAAFRSESEAVPRNTGCAVPGVPPAPSDRSPMDELRCGNYSGRADWGMKNEGDDPQPQQLHQHLNFDEGINAGSLLAAVGLVLSLYSGQTSPVIAALTRDPEKTDQDLGAHEGIVLVPLSCKAALSAGELLQRSTQGILNTSSWYTAALAGTLAVECENHGEVLAGVYFGHVRQEKSVGTAPTEYVPCMAPPFPLTIACTPEAADGYRLTFIFRPKDFAVAVVAQFMNAVVRIHAQLRRNPGTTLGAIDLLSAAEQGRVAALGRLSRALNVPDERIEDVFAMRAMQNPHATALSCGEDRLTYRELDERSTRMALALRNCGVREGDRVGVCLERSLELVEVLLAILKAGGAYVPVDPAYPVERLTYTMNDAKIGIVISAAKDFPAGPHVRVLEPCELLRQAPVCQELPPRHVSASDAVYVIYTSGSTGRPKGVVVSHRNVMGLLAATTEQFGLSPKDIWTLFHSSAFDFSVWEIWGCLLTGGHLVVAPYWVTRNPEEFAELLSKERVTVLNQTPSAFAQLLDVDRSHPVSSTLRLVIFGGEPLNSRMLLPWFDRHPEFECRMVNMFGITETTVHVTLEIVTREHALASSKSVGHALPGWYYYVMDPGGRLLPPGATGEIFVGGAGVAQSYLNRPELTAQRFVPDPFTGERIYRSGDKGRLRLDGRLEHLGRMDTQVKIRGFRIELDEIRSVLLEAEGVHTAAVVLNQADPNDPATAQLHAYVVLNGATVSDVRTYVSRVLPEYMVPSALIEVPALPLTHNGKLDTSRLPVPARQTYHPLGSHAPRKPEERADQLTAMLLQIWETVLGVPVGLDDNFFDLGGNSLYAMRIATAMRKEGMPPLPARELYVQQTIRRLGTFLKT